MWPVTIERDMFYGTVAVVGVGYVGLPVACAFAGEGVRTYAIDLIPERIREISEGRCPILGDEPGLPELLSRVVADKTLVASTEASHIREANAVLVCVDTPIDEASKAPKLDILRSAVRTVGTFLSKGALVSIESTLPPLTMKNVVIPELEEQSGLKAGRDFHVVHCPERVMPGRLLSNLRNYERVLGGLDEASVRMGLELYSTIVKSKLHPTDLLSAEITKTIENAYRDVQIAFANEVALACEELGADAFEVRRLVNTCPFRDMHIPGAGVGGHCLPKDSWLFASSLHDTKLRLIPAARMINEGMPEHMILLTEKALKDAGRQLADSKIAILGLAFLKDSDDVRHSPAIPIAEHFLGKAQVVVHDPFVQDMKNIPLTHDLEKAMAGADCIVIVTDHTQYKNLDWKAVKGKLRTPIIIDGRNVIAASDSVPEGMKYYGLGKGKAGSHL
jgi:UDP-N-acetyl-D-mannosaminuronic acid dehydrogenase